MATIINADTSTGGAIITGDGSGQLALQAAGNTAITINSSRAIGVGASSSFGTSGQLLTSGGSAAAPTWTTVSSGLTLATPVNSTSGTSIDFTGIPANVKQINVMFSGISINATTEVIVQLGDSGGIENTGYSGTYNREPDGVFTPLSLSDGFIVADFTNAAWIYNGILTINILNSTSNSWVSSLSSSVTNSAQVSSSAGAKALSATLDRIRITTTSGTATFDAGQINIAYA